MYIHFFLVASSLSRHLPQASHSHQIQDGSRNGFVLQRIRSHHSVNWSPEKGKSIHGEDVGKEDIVLRQSFPFWCNKQEFSCLVWFSKMAGWMCNKLDHEMNEIGNRMYDSEGMTRWTAGKCFLQWRIWLLLAGREISSWICQYGKQQQKAAKNRDTGGLLNRSFLMDTNQAVRRRENWEHTANNTSSWLQFY